MATEFQVVIDRADPGGLAMFWVDALHYELQDPPDGFQTWNDLPRAQRVPEESWNDARHDSTEVGGVAGDQSGGPLDPTRPGSRTS